MKIRFALIFAIFHSAAALCIELPDESAMDPLVHDLQHGKAENRETAAAALRKIAASNQKAVEQAGEYWKSKIALVKPGMTNDEVHKILPPHAEQPETSGRGSGQSHSETFRLDYHWLVTVFYNNPDSVRAEPPVLSKREMSVGGQPPELFTGNWTDWYVNGEKAHDVGYKDAKFDGLFIAYHDNGQKSYEQHFSDNQIDGPESGWHANGKKSYEGQHKDGKHDGTWIWWYASGAKQSEKSFKNGVADGADLRWYENGQQQYELHYKDGKVVGREAAWDEKGKIQYDRQHDSNK